MSFAVVPGTGVVGVRPSLTGEPIAPVEPGSYANRRGVHGAGARHVGQCRPQLDPRAVDVVRFDMTSRACSGSLERMTLEWRLAATNVLNRVTFATIDRIITSPQFGRPTAANPMRRIQTLVQFRVSGTCASEALEGRVGELRRALAVLLVVVQSASLLAQAPHAASRRSARATLLIVQTVTVKDKKGQPIAGLTAKDFVVTEDGVPQDIAFVEYQKLDAPPLGATDDATSDLPQTYLRPGSDRRQTPVTAVDGHAQRASRCRATPATAASGSSCSTSIWRRCRSSISSACSTPCAPTSIGR